MVSITAMGERFLKTAVYVKVDLKTIILSLDA